MNRKMLTVLGMALSFIPFASYAELTQADQWAISYIQEQVRQGNSRLSGELNDLEGNPIPNAYDFIRAFEKTPEDKRNVVQFDKRTHVQAVFLDAWGERGDFIIQMFANDSKKMEMIYSFGKRSGPRGGRNATPTTFDLGWLNPGDSFSAKGRRINPFAGRGSPPDARDFKPIPLAILSMNTPFGRSYFAMTGYEDGSDRDYNEGVFFINIGTVNALNGPSVDLTITSSTHARQGNQKPETTKRPK